MSERSIGQVDRLPVGLVKRVGRWALVSWLAATLGLLAVDGGAAASLALGGAVSLGSFGFHGLVVSVLLRPGVSRLARVGLWLVWLAKWPVLGVGLWVALQSSWMSLLWLCLGLGVVPAVTTALVVKSLAAEKWSGKLTGGAKW